MSKQVMIRYVKYCSVKREYHEVSHDDLDDWTVKDFETNGMFESLLNLEYVRLYFDIDFHEGDVTIDKVRELINILDGFKDVFGNYTFGGYCTDKELYEQFDKKFKFGIEFKDKNLGKPLSFHVIFPGSKILQNELCEIMTNKLYVHPIKQYVDPAVYKVSDKEQLFRHPYANKYKTPFDKSIDQYKGVNFEKLEYYDAASDLVATPYGTERKVITRDIWEKIFIKEEAKKPVVVEQKVVKQEVEQEITNIDEAYQDKTFTMSKPCFEALYKGFESLTINADAKPCNEEITLWPLFSALYVCIDEVNITKDDFYDAIAFIKEHANLTENAAGRWDNEIKRVREKNTKCTGPGALFTYMKTFNNDYYIKNVRKYCLHKCVADDDIKFDLKDEFCVSDIREKGFNSEYQIETNEKLNYNAVLRDLRKVLIVVDQGEGIYVLKERDAENDRMTVRFYNQKTMFSMLKQLKVGTELKKKNYKQDEEHIIETKSAFDVYNASTNNKMFYKAGIRFYSTNPRDFSFYQGYKYNAVRNDVLIEKFNNHIKNIWCKGNEELYNYVQSWFATVIQKPLGRCGTALVIKGIEGTGKNTITDVWCELLAGYANSNVSDIDSIVGKFNTAVENKKLLVCNEMDSADMNTTSVFNRLKKLITEKSVDIHTKNVSVRTGVQNVSNYIFISNEFNPVKITGTDRRYCIITPSEEVAGDNDYFDKLYDVMKGDIDTYKVDFMEALMYYYMNYDVKIKLNNIPETLERVIAKQANKSAIESFVEEYCVELSEDGLKPDEAFDNFNRFVVKNGYQTKYKKTTFKAEMTKYCAVYDNGQLKIFKKQRVYRFTDANIKKYASMVVDKKAEECVDDSDSE